MPARWTIQISVEPPTDWVDNGEIIQAEMNSACHELEQKIKNAYIRCELFKNDKKWEPKS